MPDGNANIVLDFTQIISPSAIHSVDRIDSDDCGPGGRSVIISGDVLIVFRQLGQKHMSSCKKCASVLCSSTFAHYDIEGALSPRRPYRQHFSSQIDATQSLEKSSSLIPVGGSFKHLKYIEGEAVFAMFPFHTGFMGDSAEGSDFRLMWKSDLDIPPGFHQVFPDDLEIHLLLEPVSSNFINGVSKKYVENWRRHSQEYAAPTSIQQLIRSPTISFSPPASSQFRDSIHSDKSKSTRSAMSGLFSFVRSTFSASTLPIHHSLPNESTSENRLSQLRGKKEAVADYLLDHYVSHTSNQFVPSTIPNDIICDGGKLEAQ